jgi:DNA-binding transcriptional ArsR family regulator
MRKARSTPENISLIRIPQLSLILSELLHRSPDLISNTGNARSGSTYEEKYLRRLLWYLLGGTRGGPNRAEIIKILQNRPCNANQLAETLRVDYKTIQHHVRILEDNGLVSLTNKGSYGAVLFLTAKMEDALPILDEIWSRIGTRKIRAKAEE